MALQGQAALVLGAASGIGNASAHELLRAGANVAVCDLSSANGAAATKKLQEEFGPQRCFFFQADVRDDDKLEAAFIATKKHFGRLDILVNSAGILNDYDWNLEVDVNLKGVIRGTLLAWKHMGTHEGGRGGAVVNVASILGVMHIAGVPVYTATKHAVVGFGKSCGEAFHLERTGVRVITLCPGVTETPLIVLTGKPQMLTPETAKEFERELATYPNQKVENVARAVRQLAERAPSGSVWVSEGEEAPYEVVVPERQDMRVAR